MKVKSPEWMQVRYSEARYSLGGELSLERAVRYLRKNRMEIFYIRRKS